MKPFEERLIAEQKELKERLAKLTDFINFEKLYALRDAIVAAIKAVRNAIDAELNPIE